MRTTRTWTISLPPEMSLLADELAEQEHRTKSELVREALRQYMARGRHGPRAQAVSPMAQAGELAAFYHRRHPARRLPERELRAACRGVRELHERLKHLADDRP